jgi:hypothetical protein
LQHHRGGRAGHVLEHCACPPAFRDGSRGRVQLAADRVGRSSPAGGGRPNWLYLYQHPSMAAPPGGCTPTLGTNPFAYGLPAGRYPPVVLIAAPIPRAAPLTRRLCLRISCCVPSGLRCYNLPILLVRPLPAGEL